MASTSLLRRPRWRASTRAEGAPLLLLLGLVLLATVLWPLAMLVIGAFRRGSPLTGGSWTSFPLSRVWHEMNDGHALLNSVILAMLTTVLGVAFAFVLAFLSERTDTALRWLIRPLVLISICTSPMFYAMGYDLLANKYTGALNKAWESLSGSGSPIVNVESWAGIVAVDSLHASAFVYLYLVGPLHAFDRTHDEASLVSGAGRLTTLLRIDIPLATPILSSVVLIGLVSGLQSFDAPLILGTPANLHFLAPRIYSLLNENNPPLYGDASAISTLLAIVVVLLAVTQHRILARRSFTSVTGKAYRNDAWRLGRWRYMWGTVVALYALIAIVLPFGSILLASFQPFPGVFANLSGHNYQQLLANPVLPGVIRTTVLLAVLGGFLGSAFAFALAAAASRGGARLGAVLRGVTLLPLAMPGVVAAVAVVWAYATVPGLRVLFGTVWLLMIAVVVAILPVVVQIASGALQQISRDLEDAARVAGASATRTALTVTLRLLATSLIAAWLLAAVLIASNLDAPLVLSDSHTQTVSTQTYLFFTDQGQGQAAALLTLTIGGLLVLGGLAAIALSTVRRLGTARASDRALATQHSPLDEPATSTPHSQLISIGDPR